MRQPNNRSASHEFGLQATIALMACAYFRLVGRLCAAGIKSGAAILLILVAGCFGLPAAESMAASNSAAQVTPATNSIPTYNVQSYVIEGRTLLATNLLIPLFSKYTGTNISLEQIRRAAADLQLAYYQQGALTMNIIIAPKRITNGVVTLSVFPGAIGQIVVAGNRYFVSKDGLHITTDQSSDDIPGLSQNTSAAATTTKTNVGPHFAVEKYIVMGNTVLPPEVISKSLTNVPSAFGTNVTIDGIRSAVAGLQGTYRDRGYVTVAVAVPAGQKLNTNHPAIKLQVTEGRLAAIQVKGNHYFSSNNVMSALPSLHTNILLNGLIFQAELNRANANQDRQIYPFIDPGFEPGTSDLTLKVKDRLPFHAKVELNNQSSPGTPDLRINSSAVYNNLWQLEHSMGIQYGFSPEYYKTVAPEVSTLGKPAWNFYDQPLVANYSGFYRMPLGRPEAVEDAIASHPGSFGYNEATRKFNLPPPSGQPEINFYASRSTIDGGLTTLSSTVLVPPTNGYSLSRNEVQQDLTENNDLGFRLSVPLPTASSDFHSGLSGGLDFKTYQLTSYKTNVFLLNNQELVYVSQSQYSNYVGSADSSPVPVTVRSLQYLPLSLRYDATLNAGTVGVFSFGLGINGNAWYSGSSSNLQSISGSTKSSGNWVTLAPSLSWVGYIYTNWMTTLRTDGQWANEPLISNEQFGAGGIGSVRGYQEGQVFGDTGWHISFEQQTPPHVVGPVYGNIPLIVRGSFFMDYATVYLLDPQRRSADVPLWGTGVGGVASIGSHWEARFMLSVPLLKPANTSLSRPFFNFGLTAQF